MQNLEKDLKETEAALSVSWLLPHIQESKEMSGKCFLNILFGKTLQSQIEELNVQNHTLLEKLNAEEKRRKSAEKSQVLFLFITETVSLPCNQQYVNSLKAVGTSRRIHLWLFPTERLSHSVPGAWVGQPQGGSGHEKPTASPAGEKVDGTGKTGKIRLGAVGNNYCPQLSSFLFGFVLSERQKYQVGWEPY